MILVTGGTGFLGHNLVPTLAAEGYHVRVVTRRPEEHPWLHNLPVEIVHADVIDREAMFRAAEGCRYVIHAAGKFRFWGRQDQFEQTNVQGANNVMDAALAAGVEKFIHISTVVVIGQPHANFEIDETHPAQPIDGYQRSKLKGEHLALRHFVEHKLPVIILRPGAFYGPYGRYAFNKFFFEDPLRGLPIGVAGGRLFTFPAYIKDVVQAILLSLQFGVPGEIYNICSQYLQHRDVDQIIKEEAQMSRWHFYFPAWMMIPFAQVLSAIGYVTNTEPYYPITLRSYILKNWCVSTNKAQIELGFTPTSFRDGVRETLAWYREIGVWKPKE